MDKKYKLGYTVGVFDLFHVGHLNLLERCKEYCEKLCVGVCDDRYVREIKHKEPVIGEDDRLRIIRALKCVDDAFLTTYEETENKLLVTDRCDFDVLFSGDDWKGSERYLKTEREFAEVGKAIVYLPYTKGISTSGIKEKLQTDAGLKKD